MLEWPAYRRERNLVTFAAAVIGAIGAIWVLRHADWLLHPDASPEVRFGGIAATIACIAVVALHLWLRAHLTEALILTPDSIVVSLPASRGLLWRTIFGWDSKEPFLRACPDVEWALEKLSDEARNIWRPRRELALARDMVTDLRVEGRGRFGHVTIALGKACVDIGKTLPDDSREWLIEVLQEWHHRGDVTN